jgi:ABC-type transport system involved in multi-copper enzyme maturation permease subunit
MSIAGPLRSEWLKSRSRPLEQYTAVIAIVLGVLIPAVMIFASRQSVPLRKGALAALAFPSSVASARTMLGIVGPLFAAALGANIAGAEYQYGTWPWLLVRSAGRGRLFMAKLVIGAIHVIGRAALGVLTFTLIGALICVLEGSPVRGEARETMNLLYSFITVLGTMAFAAAIALMVTMASRTMILGVLTGVLALPVLEQLRFKETALWNYYGHLQNVELYLSGLPRTMLLRRYEFDLSVSTSIWMLVLEMLAVIIAAYLVFRRQEIVY